MCMIDVCDETFLIYNEKWVSKTRKAHKCGECDREIAVGEECRTTSGLYGGMWSTNYVCHHCTFATRWLWENCGGYVDNGVQEDIYYHINDEFRSDHACWRPMARVLIGMRNKWRNRDGSLMRLPREIPTIPPVI